MQGDFSVLNFDPGEQQRGVSPPSRGVLRNVSGVLHQQGRVVRDADLTEGELLELAWNGQAGRDVIGAGVAAVPATSPDGFKIEAAFVTGGAVHLSVRPGRVWADGILTHLAGDAANPAAPVERLATYFGPPIADPAPAPDSIADAVRDAVILEVSEEALHAFQYPDRLLEAALGGPDTAERSFVNVRFRLLRLGDDEDCASVAGTLADDPAAKGKLTVSLAPVVALNGDCPVVGGGGYTGFEHNLYRVEIADGAGPARFKWSQWNGGLVGRGRFDATTTPAKVFVDAGRPAIVNSGLVEFYLEALQYDEAAGAWAVVYGTTATLNSDHDLELTAPPLVGTMPSTADPVFFRVWNGIADISRFTNAAAPQPLRDGIRLVFDAPAAGNYRPGDYWTFPVRAGEIANPAVLVDHAPPVGIVYHRVPLALINWTGRHDTRIDGSVEDCRRRFRPLSNRQVCCTLLVGDGVGSFGDFNSLEEAALHLPAAGGELCLLGGVHRANLTLDGRRNVTVHGCGRRTIVLPRTETKAAPILRLIDCVGVDIHGLDLVTYDGIPILVEGRQDGSCRDVRIADTRMIARVNAIRASGAAELTISGNRLHLLDTPQGRAIISLAADNTLVERNTLAIVPFVEQKPRGPSRQDDPTRDPADPCANTDVLYAHRRLAPMYAAKLWTLPLALLVPKQPYRAVGGIHVRPGSERVRILENVIVGGAGNGVTLGGDLERPDVPPPPRLTAQMSVVDVGRSAAADSAPDSPVAVTVGADGQFLALVQDEEGKPVPDVDVFLEGQAAATDRADARGMASLKAPPGASTLEVSPAHRIVRVSESREQRNLVHVITVAPRQVTPRERGFLHEITIEQNDISSTGLSGVGFALRTGASIEAPAPAIPPNDPKGALLALLLDAAIQGLALAPLLRATDPVRDLVVIGNRIHHNLLNPFDDAMRAAAQVIGRGGVSLAVVDSAVISGNQIYENGPRASDPACGVFVAYGDDLEIADNVLAANGSSTRDYERTRQAGLRGGIYVRFAGALTNRSSVSSGRKPALRVHDNRVDQPAGRPLTAFAFGPLSCVNNHFNSEFAGQFQFIDAAVGGVLICNLGGVHRLLARWVGALIDRKQAYGSATEVSLPGGETTIDDNQVRLGSGHRSLTSQLIIALDDLGFAANQSSIYHRNPLFANALAVADSVRVTSSRFREDTARTISLLSLALRMNMVSLNQADHCIVALPAGPPVNGLPTQSVNNQVIDFEFCSKAFLRPNEGIAGVFARAVASGANELGGALPQDAFTAADLAALSHLHLSRSLDLVAQNESVRTRAYQVEAMRLADKLGADNPRVVSLTMQADAGAVVARLVATSAEAAAIQPPAATPTTATLVGRFANEKGQGQAGYAVELVRADGSRVATIGRTDASGAFTASFDADRTASLEKEGNLFVRVTDADGREQFRASDPIAVKPGAVIDSSVTRPVPIVAKSAAASGTVIFEAPSIIRTAPSETKGTTTPTAPPEPGTPTEPARPKEPETPKKPAVEKPPARTPATRPKRKRK